MRNLIKSAKMLIVSGTFAAFLCNCNSNDYLIGGGTADPYFDGNIMQFLESRPDYFKDLVEIIKLADMESVLENETVTFFAPTDWSIRSSFNYLNTFWYHAGHDSIRSFSQIKPEVWREFLSMYIV
jgi:hypothetical protein